MNVKQSESPELKLFQNAEFSDVVDYDLNQNTFYTIGTIDVSNLSPDRLVIFVYGHANYESAGENFEYLVLPNVFGFQSIETTSGAVPIDGGYRYVDGQIQVGIFHTQSTNYTPTAPYSTVRVFYAVFYY